MKKLFFSLVALGILMSSAFASQGGSKNSVPPSNQESKTIKSSTGSSASSAKKDINSWIYGKWRCQTPYGTIEVIIKDNGRMYDGIEERWFNYTIEGDRIIEQLNGFISSYNIDRANKRFDCGKPGYWFKKVSN